MQILTSHGDRHEMEQLSPAKRLRLAASLMEKGYPVVGVVIARNVVEDADRQATKAGN